MAITQEARSPADALFIRDYFLSRATRLHATECDAGVQAEQARNAFRDTLPKCLVSVRADTHRIVRILPRGNWMDTSGEVVKASFPGYLPQPPVDGRELTRLDLAQWLISRESPLTARVVMNRLWKQFFSSGLSKVLDDLGAQGELPPNQPGDGSFASNCLLARRLAERGVRFIQLYHRDWDHHSQLREELPLRAREVDQACAALIQDLQQRGLFEDTLIVWSGEFGRTPMSQSNKGTVGRDPHNKAMSLWLAGAGIQRGQVYGATDDLGYAAVEDVCTVHDFHATLLQQLGIQHEAFSFKFQGLDARLTGVEGARVITGILS